MSTTTRILAQPKTANLVGSSTAPSALVRRIKAEVDDAAARVLTLQTEAAKAFAGKEQQLKHFMRTADRIHSILVARLNAFTTVDVFRDVEHDTSLELRGPESHAFHGRTTTATVPRSDDCATPMEFDFCVGHDGPIEKVIMDYRIRILPIFIKFNSHHQSVIPLDQLNESDVAAWIDERLVEVTQTYFEMSFNHEYQKKRLELDPVMNIHFPRAFAAQNGAYRNRTYYFYTNESFEAFEKNPSEYV